MDDSTEEQRRKCCVGKRHYRTAAKARKAAKRTNRSTRDGREVRPYSCPFCLMFHVGGRDKHPMRIEVYEDGQQGWRSVVYDPKGLPVAEFKANEKKHATFLATVEAGSLSYGTGQV